MHPAADAERCHFAVARGSAAVRTPAAAAAPAPAAGSATAGRARRRGTPEDGVVAMSSLSGCVLAPAAACLGRRAPQPAGTMPHADFCAEALALPAAPLRRCVFRKSALTSYAPKRLAGASAWARRGRARLRPWWLQPLHPRRLRQRKRPRASEPRSPRRQRAPHPVRAAVRSPLVALITDAAFPALYACAAPAAAPSAKPEAAPKAQAPSSANPPEARTVLVTQACPPQVCVT